jgi:small subunit ribosomal protein S14
MARKAMIAKEKQKAEVVERYREKRNVLRKILKSQTASQEEKMEARRQMDNMPRRSIGVRVMNRCRVTGRPRGYMRKFQMSRITFRELASRGMIPGVTKSSW